MPVVQLLQKGLLDMLLRSSDLTNGVILCFRTLVEHRLTDLEVRVKQDGHDCFIRHLASCQTTQTIEQPGGPAVILRLQVVRVSTIDHDDLDAIRHTPLIKIIDGVQARHRCLQLDVVRRSRLQRACSTNL
jgi:hypothetical protein